MMLVTRRRRIVALDGPRYTQRPSRRCTRSVWERVARGHNGRAWRRQARDGGPGERGHGLLDSTYEGARGGVGDWKGGGKAQHGEMSSRGTVVE
ncbi:hypothetical protein BCR44DRAFT_1436467 [Catenaria anguillulae PL171]|uniref:Uncharacterized protein n=1 Tax=Catenaria anguillulae PL171 TaxID=765915 RepID=A0A1Y2HKU3_9FUNG|nr:hypothetical protein BCR44DRAFT_1436467 [Catenaria anguillulae PL171]